MKVTVRYFVILFLSLGLVACSSNDDDNNSTSEICNNGIDDDGDGQVDCADGNCSENENCTQGGSDFKIKDNITSLQYGLAEALQLDAKMYSYKADETSEKRIGFIAQDVQLIMPELVGMDVSNEHLNLKYMDMMAVLVNAIKEQQLLINANKQQIEALNCQLEERGQLK